MITHYILLSSSYSTHRRIVLHFLGDSKEEYIAAVREVSRAYDGKIVPFSTHTIISDSESWESVVETDPYFDDVAVIGTVAEFVELVKKERYLTGLHVAKYILSKMRCTHARLEKLTYMCYADYLCTEGSRLFEDKIYAFDYGPVVGTVYREFTVDSHDRPGMTLDDSVDLVGGKTPPIMSRIIFSEDGWRKLGSIDATLRRCEGIPTQDLIDATHRPDTPWSVTDRSERFAVIDDGDILRLHANEVL